MNDHLASIVHAVGEHNLATSLSRNECGVDPSGLPSRRVVVDADLAFPAHQRVGIRCDYVLFFADAKRRLLVAAPIELKSGRADVTHACAQLQHGADFAADVAPPDSACQPVLIHGKRINLRELNRAKVLFRGRRMTIRTGRCNRAENLAHALSVR